MKKFKKIYIEITNACNLSCKFCPSVPGGEFMEVEKFGQIIRDVSGYTDYVYFHVMGEPLLHDRLGNLLDICKEYGIKVNLTTNGILIKEKGRVIQNRLRQVNFSLHCITQNEFTDWEMYLYNILDFVKKSDGDTYYCFRLWDRNDMLDKTHANVLSVLEKEYGIKISKTETKGNGIILAKNIFLQQEKQFCWPQIGLDEIFVSGTCYGLKSHVAILVNGTVVPCCLDWRGDIALGNIFEDSFSNILESGRAQEISDGFDNRIPIEPLCRTCGFGKSLLKNISKK